VQALLLEQYFLYAAGTLQGFLCFSYFLVLNYLGILLGYVSHVEVPYNLKAGS